MSRETTLPIELYLPILEYIADLSSLAKLCLVDHGTSKRQVLSSSGRILLTTRLSFGLSRSQASWIWPGGSYISMFGFDHVSGPDRYKLCLPGTTSSRLRFAVSLGEDSPETKVRSSQVVLCIYPTTAYSRAPMYTVQWSISNSLNLPRSRSSG
jgi:hypothetical protein